MPLGLYTKTIEQSHAIDPDPPARSVETDSSLIGKRQVKLSRSTVSLAGHRIDVRKALRTCGLFTPEEGRVPNAILQQLDNHIPPRTLCSWFRRRGSDNLGASDAYGIFGHIDNVSTGMMTLMRSAIMRRQA